MIFLVFQSLIKLLREERFSKACSFMLILSVLSLSELSIGTSQPERISQVCSGAYQHPLLSVFCSTDDIRAFYAVM